MASSNWKVFPDLSQKEVEHVPFGKSRKFFAVDDSGSTSGVRIKKEREFVEHIRNHQFFNNKDAISLWGSQCDKPTTNFGKIEWRGRHGGTSPAQVLKHSEALTKIQKSEVWFLVTDGQILDSGVHELANLAQQYNILNVPIVFLIVGNCGLTPEMTNISVGISFFAGAQDTLILFKDCQTGNIYVIATKGCFASLGEATGVQDLASWTSLPKFTSEVELMKHFQSLEIKIPKAESRSGLPRGINLGPDWEEANKGPAWVDLDLLVQAGRLPDKDVFELLSEEAFNNLAVAYKIRGRIQEIRAFIQAQKIEQLAPKLEDVAGAASIIAKLGLPEMTSEERKLVQEQLREAHAKNREHYQNAINNFAGSLEAQAIRNRNQLVDAALRTLTSIEAASFNAEILSRRSNRARRAEVVTTDSSVAIAHLDLEGPAYRGYCLVCCGEDEVMSICLKAFDAEHIDDNTTDFALNFPLAAGSSTKNVNMISSQNVCFQCALLAPSGMSIFKEQLKAIIPAVHYGGHNKKYINEQLYFALTSGLVTGAAGVAQLFMAILNEVLQTKSWAGAGLNESAMSADEQTEAIQRKRTFDWMLGQLVRHTRTRETFNELGDWVKFPQALDWVAKDFQSNGLASFAVTYPSAGFSKLLSFGMRTSAFTSDIVRRMRIAKAVYSIAAKYLADMQNAIQNRDHSQQWKQKYLEVIYQKFNATMIPKDLGLDSAVCDVKTFGDRLAACLGGYRRQWRNLADDKDGSTIMQKMQLILFWLVYQQKAHCTAQTFFYNISQREHLATAVLDASLAVPENELRSILLSIFAKEASEAIDDSAAALHRTVVPFSNPFGASVVRCGVEACRATFCDRDMQTFSPRDIDRVRQARAKHLINVFGLRGRFENSETGLPEPTATGKPPASTHLNLHISVARCWAERDKKDRRAVVDDINEREVFVAAVRSKICEQGRGDVFSSQIDQDVRDVLPSFFSVLALALRLDGQPDEDITIYEHNFTKNKMEEKVRWELRRPHSLA
ncbi:uncharacterized protein N0V89_004842 [Didymosphaeria variabile]|uniref:VWFA domain-containing protein n=1 Tax=Didymosphaeria variabile TaxID=1932322 RepID=A0A9W8XQ58_9PLEO|nr:uncharacterized protein N0V89_004842 [Didymosphaeria variabile]KAJ4356805.1 hypothetical protein N0V89_004842 [Didymosphaeria variabile]